MPVDQLRSLTGDPDYVRSFCRQSAVRSCWSATPTVARSSPRNAAGVPNVKALVYPGL